jgi:hypothetical protein
MVIVTFEECKRELIDRSPAAQRCFDRWIKVKTDRGESNVVDFVRKMAHEYIFKVSHADVVRVANNTEHALGLIERNVQTRSSKDASCPYAFHHLFHGYIRKYNVPPSWEVYRDWLHSPPVVPYFVEPLRQGMGWKTTNGVTENTRIDSALQWRLGNFYLSGLREIEALARLRDAGFVLKYHVLADVLFAVDFWQGNHLFYLQVPNEFERRKTGPTTLFPYPFLVTRLGVQHQGFGKPWFIQDDAVETVNLQMLGHL